MTYLPRGTSVPIPKNVTRSFKSPILRRCDRCFRGNLDCDLAFVEERQSIGKIDHKRTDGHNDGNHDNEMDMESENGKQDVSVLRKSRPGGEEVGQLEIRLIPQPPCTACHLKAKVCAFLPGPLTHHVGSGDVFNSSDPPARRRAQSINKHFHPLEDKYLGSYWKQRAMLSRDGDNLFSAEDIGFADAALFTVEEGPFRDGYIGTAEIKDATERALDAVFGTMEVDVDSMVPQGLRMGWEISRTRGRSITRNDGDLEEAAQTPSVDTIEQASQWRGNEVADTDDNRKKSEGLRNSHSDTDSLDYPPLNMEHPAKAQMGLESNTMQAPTPALSLPSALMAAKIPLPPMLIPTVRYPQSTLFGSRRWLAFARSTSDRARTKSYIKSDSDDGATLGRESGAPRKRKRTRSRAPDARKKKMVRTGDDDVGDAVYGIKDGSNDEADEIQKKFKEIPRSPSPLSVTSPSANISPSFEPKVPQLGSPFPSSTLLDRIHVLAAHLFHSLYVQESEIDPIMYPPLPPPEEVDVPSAYPKKYLDAFWSLDGEALVAMGVAVEELERWERR
ncbi:hypothetical protein HDU93_008175 [Gonapodya sp. JEL0774]|nr:hypothetical protein HDU93_008175 [Gonapodya sp. JEL0774]